MRFLPVYVLSLLSIIFIPTFCLADADKAPAWTYDDDMTGQEDWGAIEGYEACGSGMEQSPINISYTKLSNLPKLDFQYSKVAGSLNTNKQSYIVEVDKGGTLLDGKEKYTLQSIEIHSPSGHRIRDVFHPMEIHLIHKNQKDELLIVAIFADIGAANESIDNIIKLNHASARSDKVDLSSLVNNTESYYSYAGSLPYPPCTEKVQWRIIKAPISISKKQLSSIVSSVGRNTRLPQPVYMREVLEGN
jgi:carbonic anhydrase